MRTMRFLLDSPCSPAEAIDAVFNSIGNWFRPYWEEIQCKDRERKKRALRSKCFSIVWHDRLLVGGKRARYWEEV